MLILSIFIVGMLCGTATAGHTFEDKGYKYKMSTKEVNKHKKNAKKNGRSYDHYPVSKTVHRDSMEKVTKKQFKKAQKSGSHIYGKNYDYIDCKKTSTGCYKVTLKKHAFMNCGVFYYKGNYHYSATAYTRK